MTDLSLEVDVAARIKAARLLRGITQDELAKKLADGGLPWRLAGQLERGEVQVRSATLAELCRALEMPERWFTDPVDELWASPAPDPQRERLVAALDRKLDRIIELLERR